ncbi:MAG: class I SAM-dependent methyltransferase [Parcubacteria group bacterium]|nr:class I SAM-dependent methyltransferase [Parcubacteria group bacterium]MCR4343065.1 class I SAM-dependent methyltransferase [Patescibacteria group bacterium]
MFLNPEQIIKRLDINPGIIAVDFGCGTGHWSVALAKQVGDIGKVYALDIQKEMLEATKSRAEALGLLNVEVVRGDLDEENGSNLSSGIADFVLLSNILFQADKREVMVKEASRVLKSGGEVAIIEWDQSDVPLGPPKQLKLKPEDARRMFLEAGFVFKDDFPAGEHHYGLLFKKM